MFFCEANNGLEIRGSKVYGQTNAGDSWYDNGQSAHLPMTESLARLWVRRYLRFSDAPARSAALSALTGRHFAASEA